MVKSELMQALKDKFPELHERDVKSAINAILKQMTEALVQGEHIEIRGFGSFDCRYRSARLTRNPKTGATVHSSATVAVRFKSGKDMRDRVNAASHQCDITD
jgi:integration host factor subunit beta